MKIIDNFDLKNKNSWGIGGHAARALVPDNLEQLQQWLKSDSSDNLFWLGLGSNVLIADGVVDVTLVQPRGFLRRAYMDRHVFVVESGVNCARIAKDMARAGYRDAVFFCGIPGTMGGALRMNAGAFGGETWTHVVFVDVMMPDGRIERMDPSDFDVSYRHVAMPVDGWFVRAGLSFSEHYNVSQQSFIGDCLRKRMLSQPVGELSCGSVFKNPFNGYAAQYIESAGLKGFKIGQAEVSQMHANFMINRGDCTADDMYALICGVRQRVYEQHGVVLEPEVHCVGFEPIADLVLP